MSYCLPRRLLAGLAVTLAAVSAASVEAYPHPNLHSADQPLASRNSRLATPNPWQPERGKTENLGEPVHIAKAFFDPALPAAPSASRWQSESQAGR
jgi:hypothetical protein